MWEAPSWRTVLILKEDQMKKKIKIKNQNFRVTTILLRMIFLFSISCQNLILQMKLTYANPAHILLFTLYLDLQAWFRFSLGLSGPQLLFLLTPGSEKSLWRESKVMTNTTLDQYRYYLSQHISIKIKHFLLSKRCAPISQNSEREKGQTHVCQTKCIPKLVWKTELN